MRSSIASLLAAAALTAFVAAPAAARTTTFTGGEATPATASSFIDVNMAGWATFGGFGRPGNSQVFVDVGAGTTVVGFEYSNLAFTTQNGSYLSELVLSVNNSDASEYMDWSPSLTDEGGSFGPAGGTWGGAAGGPGPFGEGGSFVTADGVLWITVYEGFDDPLGDTGLLRDALISSGTLRVLLAPIPEPGTYGMMALGLLAVGAAMRRRRQLH